MSEHICNFCGKKLATDYILKSHQKTTKYCLDIQNKQLEVNYTCEFCNKTFNRGDVLRRHHKTCKQNENNTHHSAKKRLEETTLKLEQVNSQLEENKKTLEAKETEIIELKTKLEEVTKTLDETNVKFQKYRDNNDNYKDVVRELLIYRNLYYDVLNRYNVMVANTKQILIENGIIDGTEGDNYNNDSDDGF